MENFMATITFDTLKFANKLKSAGVLPEHAEAEAENQWGQTLRYPHEFSIHPMSRSSLLKVASIAWWFKLQLIAVL